MYWTIYRYELALFRRAPEHRMMLQRAGRSILHLCNSPTWDAWLHAIAVGMFLISSLLLVRFIYLYPISPVFDWSQASDSLLYIIIAASVAFFAYMVITWSFSLALILLFLSSFVSSLAELLGLSSGLTFGSLYYYNPHIEPRITEQLPLAIPLAWFIFCCTPLILLRPWLEQHRTGTDTNESTKLPGTVIAKQGIACALLLTSCDLYLEPISVYTGYWTWAQQGHYFGAPIMNFLGWFWVGLFVFSAFFYIQNHWFFHAATGSVRLDRLLIGLFVFWVVVALALIGYEFNSLIPSLLISILISPLLYLRWRKDRQITANASLSKSKNNGAG